MKPRISTHPKRQRGWALLAVLTLSATAILVMVSMMAWTSENSTVISRNNEYFATSYAAEAATEKPLSAMIMDFENYGEPLVYSKMSTYATMIPASSDNAYWTNYQFSGGTTVNTAIVRNVNQNNSMVLGPPFSGLDCQGSTFEVIANAKNNNTGNNIISTIGQQVFLGQIPIFQFAVFYQDTMEIDPGAAMNITGLVHGNNNIYADPNSGVTLTFGGDISSTGNIYLSENPLDPTTTRPTNPAVVFDGNHISGVNPLNLPVGTNTGGSGLNTSTNIGSSVDAILQVPPNGESPTSAIGTNRLYNQADMIVIISNGNQITVTSGVRVDGQAITISNNQWSLFINTNNSFYNQRDDSEVLPVNIDVGDLRQWSATNTVLRPALTAARNSSEADVESVYVADMRYLTNVTVTTSYITNTNTATTNTAAYPTAGTYIPPVATNTIVTNTTYYPSQYVGTVATNTSGTSSTSYPAAGTYINAVTTNTTSTTSSTKPSGGYLGSVSTNVTTTTTTSYPGSGTYLGTVQTNRNSHNQITGYTYNLITGYTYQEITGYTYQKITSYTYTGISGYTYNTITGRDVITNYTTNYTQIGEPGVVLTNGSVLPPNGLSVVTPDPAYIEGNWNVGTTVGSTLSAQTTNTTYTHPSAIYSDAITILSPSWNPLNSALTISSRTATADTVNAAVLTGIVPSNGSTYSGGVENFPRFLENWSGINFYYNGSMVEMFTSQIANSPWPGTGVVYNPPTRDWAFDTKFSNPTNLPPLTPSVLYVNRAQWTMLPPQTTSF